MASEACPVWHLILNVETPARVALVAKPARRLWPEYSVAPNPAAAIRSRRIKDTASPESRLAETRPCRSTGRKTGPSSTRAALSQFSSALTGQWMVRPKGMPILRPTPSWSVFDRRMLRMMPSRTCSKSTRSIAASSERLRPPANPISSKARSRRSLSRSLIAPRTTKRSSLRSGVA
jgi:hypothetical protein